MPFNVELKNSLDSLLKVIRSGAKNAKSAKPLMEMTQEANDRLADLKYKHLELSDMVDELVRRIDDIPDKVVQDQEDIREINERFIREQIELSEDRTEMVIVDQLRAMEKRLMAEQAKQFMALKVQLALTVEKSVNVALRPAKRLRPSAAPTEDIEEFEDEPPKKQQPQAANELDNLLVLGQPDDGKSKTSPMPTRRTKLTLKKA